MRIIGEKIFLFSHPKMSNSRDRQILNSILNPTLPIGEGVHDVEEETNALSDPPEPDTPNVRLVHIFVA